MITWTIFSIQNIGVKNDFKQNNGLPLEFFKFLTQFNSMI